MHPIHADEIPEEGIGVDVAPQYAFASVPVYVEEVMANVRVARFAVVVLLAAVCGCPSGPKEPPVVFRGETIQGVEIAEPIFAQGLRGPWTQEATGSTRAVVLPGRAAQVTLGSTGSFALANPKLAGKFGGVTFRLRMPPGEAEVLEVSLESSTAPPKTPFPKVKVAAEHRTNLEAGWVEILIPMRQLNPDRHPFDRVVFRAFREVDAVALELDAVGLTKTDGASDVAGDAGAPAAFVAEVRDAGTPAVPVVRPAGSKLAVKVVGNKLVDGAGAPLRLRGANHAGTEYACAQGWGIFSGPGDEAVLAAMEKWHINAIRVPLNESCWLGISGVDAAHGGQAYRDAITTWVSLAHKHGMIAVLDLHWASPGAHKALEQQAMANADHSLDFWKSVATTFRSDPAVVFDLFNEPFLNHANLSTDAWACWRSGCTVTGGEGGLRGTWRTAGMQQMVDAVRSTGATQPVMAGGLEWANDLTGWLANAPMDPLGQLIASFHQYKGNQCGSAACWTTTIASIVAKVPLVTGEVGQDDCAHDFTDRYLDWADSVGASYLMWTWNAWGDPTPTGCGSGKYPMIADWGGTPTPYGISYKARLAR